MLPSPSERGFTLLEVMFAVMIFAIGVLGLLSALQTSVEAAGRFNREAAVSISIQNRLAELQHEEFPGPGVETDGPDEIGVTYTREIEPLTLHNRHGQGLARLFLVRIRAEWGGGEEKDHLTAEVYVYRP